MSSGGYPGRVPDRPVEGGRDALAAQARAVRRLEARAATERRQSGDVLEVIPSLPAPQPTEPISVASPAGNLASRLQSTFDAVLRRSWRARHR
jgi:hypothetical protein